VASGREDPRLRELVISAYRGRLLTFRLLFVGDVVGSAGCSATLDLVPKLREELRLDAVVANAENSAPSGRGITKDSGTALLTVADFLTLGNHAFDAEGYEEFLGREKKVARPANFGGSLPGRGWGIFEVDGVRIGVTNVLGLVFVDRTSVSPGGTAYATDVGMTGCEESIIGFDREGFLGLFLGERRRLPVATRGPVIFSGMLVDFDVEGRRATGIEAVRRTRAP
jgi:calcineurin-like phosphoesterase